MHYISGLVYIFIFILNIINVSLFSDYYIKPLPSRLTRARSVSKTANNFSHTCIRLLACMIKRRATSPADIISAGDDFFLIRKCYHSSKKLFTGFDSDRDISHALKAM